LTNRKIVTGVLAMFLLIAIGRVLASYAVTAQAFDEPCHVAAAIELIDRGTYQLDPYNTPLARLAIGAPLYLAGARMPLYAPDDPARRNYNDVGNKILHGGTNYPLTLALARSGVLPFLVLSTIVVFCWTKREFGDLAAVMSVVLFTTLPVILAFSSVAYSDISAAFAQPAALFAFALWLEEPSGKRASWLGVITGLALLAKFTTLLYLPVGAAAILAVRWLRPKQEDTSKPAIRRSALIFHILAASLIAVVVVWGGYVFSTGRVQQSLGISAESMPSFQHFPGPLRQTARAVILRNPVVPAPGLLNGIASAWAFNKEGPPSYFMGQIKRGGWWYFFFVDLALKSPLAFLVLGLIGLIALVQDRARKWTALSPAASMSAILLATTMTKVYYGVRHVIAVYPLLAIVAGYGASYLWQVQGRRQIAARSILSILLVWQIGSSLSASGNFLAYFNVLAGKDPSKLFVAGCDLDCGQDLIRLSKELKARKVSHITLALWTSTDMSQADLPTFQVAQASEPVAGWFAISLRALRTGDLFHESYPQNAFDWLKSYQPVQQVGSTILLYYIPDASISSARSLAP
jgi:4-amino-4-deoxy-L-arabinose transferase-like glycosyltransferase